VRKEAIGLVFVVACSRTPAPTPVEAVPSDAAPVAVGVAVDGGNGCEGDPAKNVTCLAFDSVEDAFRHTIRGDVQILAIGEAHAQKGTEAIPSSTKHFTEQLLPIVAKQSADLLVELWMPDPKCQKEVKAVASAQKQVTEPQAATNKNEYETLAFKAKDLGVTPWLLRPSCDDFSMLADAGADVVDKSLALIKRLTEEKMTKFLEKNAKDKKIAIAYGGALHNDVSPPAETAQWCFGPALVKATNGAYVELDLIVPEYVKKTDTWQKFAWYSAWEKNSGPKDKAYLYTVANGPTKPPSYTLIFPSSSKP